MTLTHAGICFLVAVIILGIDFLLGFAGEPFPTWHARILTVALFFVALGLLLTQ